MGKMQGRAGWLRQDLEFKIVRKYNMILLGVSGPKLELTLLSRVMGLFHYAQISAGVWPQTYRYIF